MGASTTISAAAKEGLEDIHKVKEMRLKQQAQEAAEGKTRPIFDAEWSKKRLLVARPLKPHGIDEKRQELAGLQEQNKEFLKRLVED